MGLFRRRSEPDPEAAAIAERERVRAMTAAALDKLTPEDVRDLARLALEKMSHAR